MYIPANLPAGPRTEEKFEAAHMCGFFYALNSALKPCEHEKIPAKEFTKDEK